MRSAKRRVPREASRMILTNNTIKPHYSRTSSSQLLKGNGSPCLQLASSTLSRCHVSSSATSPWVPTRYSPWCAEIGRGLGAELDSSLLSPLTSFFCDQRKEYPR